MTVGILVFISAIVTTYIVTFKNDFKDEDLKIATPFVAFLLAITILSAIM